MLANPSMESAVREQLQRQWRQANQAGRFDSGALNTYNPYYPVLSLLPHLLPLAEALGDRPTDELEPEIRRIVTEHVYADSGDAKLEDPDREAQIRHEVEVVLRALEGIRRDGIERGQWSEGPVTPIMFG